MHRFPQVAKSLCCGLLKYTGAARALEFATARVGQPFLTILVFHRVTDQVPWDVLTVSTPYFERLCAMLKRTCNVVSLGEVFALTQTPERFPARTVAITFDDSYRDNLYAARVLARHQLPATFFIPTDFVETTKVFHWDTHLPPMPNLTWRDIREMRDLGFEIGSHTVTHPRMSKLTMEQTRFELNESKRVLEDRLGNKVRWFAYPYGGGGDLRPEQVGTVAEAGYEGCVSAYGGFVWQNATQRVLPRTPVPPFRSLLNLELHLRGCLNGMYAFKRRVGLMENETSESNPMAVTSLVC